jgi:hypothetical protein
LSLLFSSAHYQIGYDIVRVLLLGRAPATGQFCLVVASIRVQDRDVFWIYRYRWEMNEFNGGILRLRMDERSTNWM